MICRPRVLTLIGVALALTACGTGAVGESHGDTPTGTAAAQPVTAAEIDSLVVPIGLVAPSEQAWDGLHSGGVDRQPQSAGNPPDAGDACSLAYASADDVSVFGPHTVAFRRVRYTGVSNVNVVQTIAIYRDHATATAAFQPLFDRLSACSAPDEGTHVDSVTPGGAAWHARGFSPVSGPDSTLYAASVRVVENVVFRVTVGHFDNAPQIADDTAEQIAAKINNAA